MICNFCNSKFIGKRCNSCGNKIDTVFEENKKFFGIEEEVKATGFEKASDIFNN